jgi:hypothetical protein
VSLTCIKISLFALPAFNRKSLPVVELKLDKAVTVPPKVPTLAKVTLSSEPIVIAVASALDTIPATPAASHATPEPVDVRTCPSEP